MKLKNLIKWSMTQAAVVAMVMAPVTQGLAAEKQMQELNERRVKELISEFGFTKAQTIGEFYKKNKAQIPERIQIMIEPFIEQNKSAKIPQFEVSSVKDSDGNSVPVVRLTYRGELINMEIHGKSDNFAKIGNTVLTQIDINNFSDAIKKVYGGEPRLRKLLDEEVGLEFSKKTKNTDLANRLPKPTLELWNALTPIERAQYLMTVRTLYRDSAKVNYLLSEKANRQAEYPALEELFKLIGADDAFADPPRGVSAKVAPKPRGAPAKPVTRDTKPVGTKTDDRYNDSCVVAGYISKYEKNVEITKIDAQGREVVSKRATACTLTAALEGWDPKSSTGKKSDEVVAMYRDANEICKKGGETQVACNPIIYGYRGEGNSPICIDSKQSSYQRATHADGPCEEKGALTSKDLAYNPGEKTKYGTTPEEEANRIKLITEDPKNKELSRKYIESILNKDAESTYAKILAKPKITKEEFDQIKVEIDNVVSRFIEEIKHATNSCENQINRMIDRKVAVPKDQKLACDQLHRRWVNSEELIVALNAKIDPTGSGGTKPPDGRPENKCAAKLAKVCPAPMTTIGNGTCDEVTGEPKAAEIKCGCDGGGGSWTLDAIQKDSGFNATEKCRARAVLPPVKPDGNADDIVGSCARITAICKDGLVEKKSSSQSGAEQCVCVKTKTDPKKDEPGFFSKLFKHPWFIPGLFIGLGLWWLNKHAPKKQGITPPGDKCANGVTTCPQPCPNSLQSWVNGSCRCPEPAPGRRLTDAVSCIYDEASSEVTDVLCPDGVTRKPKQESCPTKTCADGSTTYEGLNCLPVAPPVTPPAKITPSKVEK